MGASGSLVKPRRTYDASRRRDAAAGRQASIVVAAEQRFLADGYAATTIAAVAADAGVSVHTIYKTFGGKAGLVRAIWRKALEGVGPVAAERRSDDLQMSEPEPRRIIQGWGAFTAEIGPRATPLLRLIRAAGATDPEAKTLLEELDTDRLARMTANARRLRDNGHLRAGVSLESAAEILWTYSSPELCELLMFRRGWPPDRYARFVADAMIAALL
jgi:AcrR family transcriptional regulator